MRARFIDRIVAAQTTDAMDGGGTLNVLRKPIEVLAPSLRGSSSASDNAQSEYAHDHKSFEEIVEIAGERSAIRFRSIEISCRSCAG